MSEPVDTSAEAVERAASFVSMRYGLGFDEAAAILRALARERASAQQRIADLEAQCANDATLSTALDAVIAERDAAFAQVDALREALESLYPGLALDLRYADPDDDREALASRVRTIELALSGEAAKADDWLTKEARQIGLHSPACASVRFGQNECDCGAKP